MLWDTTRTSSTRRSICAGRQYKYLWHKEKKVQQLVNCRLKVPVIWCLSYFKVYKENVLDYIWPSFAWRQDENCDHRDMGQRSCTSNKAPWNDTGMLSLKHMTQRKCLSSYGHWIAWGGGGLLGYTIHRSTLCFELGNIYYCHWWSHSCSSLRPTEPLLDRYSLSLSCHVPSQRVHISVSDRFMLLFKDY